MARPRSGKPWKKFSSAKRPAHGGGYLVAGLKNQTPLEFATSQKYLTDARAHWEYLFNPERNKWKPPTIKSSALKSKTPSSPKLLPA
jgi:hypothetical protein